MPELERWIDVPALTREPFLAINATNDTKARVELNTKLRVKSQSGDWPIPKAAFSAGLKGALVVLFFRHKSKPAEILTGRILSYRKNGDTKADQPRYRLTIKGEWKPQGTFDGFYGHFFQGLKFGSGTACAWMSEQKEDAISRQGDPDEEGGSRIGLAVQRVKHNVFVSNTLAFWGERCAITGLEDRALLQACHLVPFSEADGKEKLDGDNGVYLCVHLHALLDRYILTFSDEGDLLVSNALSVEARKLLLPRRFKKLQIPKNKDISEQRKGYFARHRALAEEKARESSSILEPVGYTSASTRTLIRPQ